MSKYSSKWIKVSEPIPHVFLIELARPPVNAFSREFWRAYGQTFDKLVAEEEDVRVAIVASAFPKIFSAGVDLTDAMDGTTRGDPARSSFNIRNHLTAFQANILKPDSMPFPVIGAVHGAVIGIGMDVFCACDIRYAASNSSFSIKEVDVGLAADIGTLAYLPKITGNQSLARELALTARPFSAAEAEKLGLVSKVVEGGREEVIKEALTLAKFLASKSPVAVSSTKFILNHARDHPVQDNLDYTTIWNGAMLRTDDIPENLRAMKTKEKPKFEPLVVKVDGAKSKL